VAAAVGVAAGADLASNGDHQGAQAAVRAAGNFGQTNSRNSQPILTIAGMKPGGLSSGTVTLTNSGDVAGDFRLSESNLTQTLGLAGQLNLLVEDVTSPTSPVTVYNGPLGTMPAQALGAFAPSTSRTYRFTVTLPAGTGNPFQNATAGAEFDWASTGDDSSGGGGTGTGGGGTGTGAGGGASGSGGTAQGGTGGQTQGGGTVGGAGQGGTPTTALKLSAARKQKASDGVTVSAVCSTRCTASFSAAVSIRGASKAYKLGNVIRTLRAGVRTKVKLKFSSKTRTAIRKALAKHRKVTVTVQATPRGGHASARRVTITLTR
jgi:hypothetical protein